MSNSKHERTPRQIIDRIRTHNFLLDIDSASEMVKEGALNLQTQLNNALKLLSDDLYSKKSHFVLELVQNADDNEYATNVTPHLTLQVTPSRLVVVNNETGFTEANVRAICSVGASSKSKQKSGYIGEKGIGFKSVFTVSDAPEIHSNEYHFKFDRTVEDNLLGYVVPLWCDPPLDAQSGCTTIVLPAAKSYEFGADTFVDLDARLLLFLKKLRQLTLVHNGQRTTYVREDSVDRSTLFAKSDDEARESQWEEMHYVRTEVTYLMREQFADEKRPGIDRSTVVLAFPVDSTGAAKPEPASNVFAFLPIRQMGFKFSIQADFILNSSREEVLTDRPWNQQLRACIAAVFTSAVETFKKSNLLALSYLRYVPAEGEVVDPFFRGLRKDIIAQLAKNKSLRSGSGDWHQPSELRIAEKAFRNLFPSKVSKELFDFDYVDPKVQGGDELLRSLGAKDVTLLDVLSVFRNHGGWCEKQSLDWRAKFYAYVADNQERLIETGLLKCPCLPISDGSCVVPAQTNVFFPLGRGKKYGFESELVFVDNQLYEEAQKHSEHVVKLFTMMKVKPDEPYEMVISHILPRHLGDAWKTSGFKALVGHIRYVKDKLKEYLDAALVHGKSDAQAYQLLRDGIWIGSKHLVIGETWQFNRVGELYLSKEYKPQFCIESHLGDAFAASRLVSPDYLAAKATDSDTESWRLFFAALGVRLAPAVEAEVHNWKCSDELQLLLDSPNSTIRRATLECMSQCWSSYSGRVSYTFQTGRTINGPLDTKFVVSLRATPTPTKKRTTAPLSDSYYPTTELKALLGDNLLYVDAQLTEAMLDVCRITYKVDARALVKRLNQLKAESGGTTKQVQAIYRALDDRLWDAELVFIKQAFNQYGLIQVRGVQKGWFKPSELAWRSSGTFLDSIYPPLEPVYRDFSKFFCDKLGIPRDLATSRRVDALTSLGGVVDIGERKKEALSIYGRANRDLGPRFGREVQIPDWIETFQTEAVFINQRGELVPNNEYLFANDAPTIAVLFEDDEDLSFVAISALEVPRLSRLFDAADVARLSESITIDVRTIDSGVANEDLTMRVRRSVHFFARILYATQPDDFQQALDEGLFSRLKSFEVLEVPQVDLVVSLGEYQRETTTDLALSGERVLYRTGARSVKDLLSAELSQFLGASKNLADSFARILMENDIDGIEDFLQVRGFGALPADYIDALEMGAVLDSSDDSSESPSDGEPREGGDDFPIEEPGSEKSDCEELSVAVDASNVRTAPSPDSTGVRPANSSSAGTEEPLGTSDATPNMPNLIPSASSSVPIVHGTFGTHEGSGSRASNGAAPNGSSVVTGEAKHTSDRDATGQHPGNSEGGVANNRAPTQSPPGSYNGSHSGSGPSYRPTNGFRGRRPPKHGQLQPPRTKAGRLLSYAAGPDEADRPNPDDDPAKVAAREATERAAVEYFMTTQAGRWKSLTEMPRNNPGFDISAVAEDGHEERIEVKGQSGAWTEEGVALTPTELMTAQQWGNRYWLCVVEYAKDDKLRQLHLVRNPYGLTQQFRFDVGWKSAAESLATVLLKPEKDMYIDMPEVGRGRIVSVRDKGRFFNLHVILDDGRQVNKPFNPAKMTLSKEPMWQE